MTPSIRSLPVIEANWSEMDRKWFVSLPGSITLPARDEAAVEELVRRYASGAAISYRRGQPTREGRA